MIMYNTCRWLIVGRSERCEKQCINDFCGIHRAATPPARDRAQTLQEMQKGTKSEIQLCSKPCRSDHAKKALHRAETKARRLNPVLMQ